MTSPMTASVTTGVAVSASLALLGFHFWRLCASLRVQREELIVEARLLAKALSVQLQKGAKKATDISMDPLTPTMSAEREVTNYMKAAQRGGRGRSSKALWKQERASMRVASVFRPSQLRSSLGDSGTDKKRPTVIGVCGMSCSGKSTVSSALRAYAADHGTYVPVICLDDSYHEWMFEPPCRRQHSNFCVPGRNRSWKNWESPQCVNWPAFLRKLSATIDIHTGFTPYIVVEGFLLLENAEAASLCDHVISIQVGKEHAWQRRLARAKAMAAGTKDASGMDNYEILPVYAVEAEYDAIGKDGSDNVTKRGGRPFVYPAAHEAEAKTQVDLSTAHGPHPNGYDWLRLYFDEVVWPEAEGVERNVNRLREGGSIDVVVVDGTASSEVVVQKTQQFISSVSKLS